MRTGHKKILKKMGYTALRAARVDGKWKKIELAEATGLTIDQVNATFKTDYAGGSWRHIIRVAEVLGVEPKDYIRADYLLNLPIEVELHFRSLSPRVVRAPVKAETKPATKTRKRHTFLDVERLTGLALDPDLSQLDMAAELNVSPTTISRGIKKLGIHWTQTKPRKDRVAKPMTTKPQAPLTPRTGFSLSSLLHGIDDTDEVTIKTASGTLTWRPRCER